MTHKAGFVNIIGEPNAGKSTLMNALVGEKLSIITQKRNTTRHRIMGIVNGDDYQIVYSDTPGFLTPKTKLHRSMMSFVNNALSDADIFMLIIDIQTPLQNDNGSLSLAPAAIAALASKTNIIVILNKIDLSTQDYVAAQIKLWEMTYPNALILPCSALTGFNCDRIMQEIIDMLPENPPYFDKDALTDKSARFFTQEIIREKILLLYDKEIPYCVEVEIEKYEEKKEVNVISATIYVERESQKSIIIGHKGSMLKQVGTLARKDIEVFTDKKCFLELFVKVSNGWRSSDNALKRFGYNQ